MNHHSLDDSDEICNNLYIICVGYKVIHTFNTFGRVNIVQFKSFVLSRYMKVRFHGTLVRY